MTECRFRHLLFVENATLEGLANSVDSGEAADGRFSCWYSTTDCRTTACTLDHHLMHPPVPPTSLYLYVLLTNVINSRSNATQTHSKRVSYVHDFPVLVLFPRDYPGTTLSTEKLLKLVIDLDKPPDTLPEAEGNERSSDSGDDSTSTSQNRADKEWDGEMGGGSSRNEKEGKGKGKGKAKTTEEEEERDGSGRGRLPTSFSRESPPKRPKISLDISDDSNSEEDDSD